MGLDDRQLRQRLLSLDGASYRAYKDIKGSYEFPGFTLIIDHVQGDPFAAPSQLRVQLSTAEAGFPAPFYATPLRAVALEDFLVRRFDRVAHHLSQRRGTGKSGKVEIIRPSQAVLKRSAAHVNAQFIEVRFTVGLPAQGRRILGRQATELLCEDVLDIVEESLFYESLSPQALQQQVATVEDTQWLRMQLAEKGLVAFVPNGAVLARQSGIDDRPLPNAIPFQAPPELEVSFTCPNRGEIKGMGIPQGVTLISAAATMANQRSCGRSNAGFTTIFPVMGENIWLRTPAPLKFGLKMAVASLELIFRPLLTICPWGIPPPSFVPATPAAVLPRPLALWRDWKRVPAYC